MALFSKILSILGIKKEEPAPAPVVKPTAAPPPVTKVLPPPVSKPIQSTLEAKIDYRDSRPAPFTAPKPVAVPAPMEMVDVMSKLEKMAKDKGEKLDWKKSIVDLLKVLGIDSSLQARKELAVELGCPPEKMKDSVNMNIWLHKTVLAKIAENGGNIPKELLD